MVLFSYVKYNVDYIVGNKIMLEILKNPLENMFLELCGNSQKNIKLCAPFVKQNIIEKIITHKKENTQLNLITNVKLHSFYKGASDIKALSMVLKSGGILYNKGNLHAKYYIFDDEKAIITSGNLTSSGLSRNYEYGILINDKKLINKIINDYSSVCDDDITGKINQEQLNEIENILSSIPKSNITLPNIQKILEADEAGKIPINVQDIAYKLSGWKKDIFEIIEKFNSDSFTKNDFNAYINNLKTKHPSNNNIEAKIRQQLQYLRDIGLIEFLGSGNYQRLWINI